MEFDPNEKDFEKVRMYPADELTVDQMTVIASNRDKLNDEEKEAFAYVLEDEEFVETAADEDEDEDTDKDADKDDAEEENANAPAFKTQAEADEYIRKQTEKALEEAKKKAENAPEAPPELPKFKVDDPNWKAKSPAELYDEMELKRKTLADHAAATSKRQSEETYKRLDSEIERLQTEGKIPKRDTEEGKKAIGQMAEIAKENNWDSFDKAYNVWSKIPVELGGGYDPEGAAKRVAASEAARKKVSLNKQKAAASKISAGKGDVSGNKPKPLTYEKMKGMHIDDITDYALEQYGR